MIAIIDGEEYNVDEVNTYSDLPLLECGKLSFYVAKDREEAGQASRDRFEDMAENDPEEFIYIVGEKTLVQWALGNYAGPGYTQVRNLEEWLDLVADNPEEELAGYDGVERAVDYMDDELLEELGWDTIEYPLLHTCLDCGCSEEDWNKCLHRNFQMRYPGVVAYRWN